MHLDSISWSTDDGEYGGSDVHLLRGGVGSADLSTQLKLTFVPDPTDAATVKATTVTLSNLLTNPALAMLKALVASGGTGTVFDAVFPVQPLHGFTIDPSTGVVSIPATPPSPQVYNFLLRASVTPAVPPAAQNPLTALLRFHFHDGIVANGVVMSPQSLTVPANGQEQRFGLLVHFTDDVVGDVSNDPNTTWALFTKGGSGTLTPVSNNKTATVTLNPSTGEITASGPSTDSLVVQATVQLNGATPVTAQAPLFVSGDVNAPLPVRFVDGAGVDLVSQVPNILLLGDGYKAAEQPLFDALVDELVQRIRYSPSSAPFSDFIRHKSINIFAGFLPSAESGCSIDYELETPSLSSLGEAVDSAADPGTDVPSTLSELIFGVGYPIPSDATAAPAALLLRWEALFSNFVAPIGGPQIQTLITGWQKLATRTLAVEHDTALGLMVGFRPNETGGGSSSVIVLNPLRAGPVDVQNLASNATVTEAGVSTAIGSVWGAAPSAKDRYLVMVLANGVPSRGTNQAFSNASSTPPLDRRITGIGIGYQVSPVPIKAFPGDSRIVALDPDPTDSTVHDATLGVFLHELSHSFECGDEYGYQTTPDSGIPFAILQKTQIFGNVTLESSILDPTTKLFTLSNTLWGALPRVRAAGALALSPGSLGGGNYRITVQIGQRAQFDGANIQPNDPLYLRLRPLMGGLAAIQNQPNQPPNFSLLQSPKLLFVSNDTSAPDGILVKLATGTTLPPTWNIPVISPFPQAPILLAPTLGTSGQELLIVSPPMKAMIEASPPVPTNRADGTDCQAPLPLSPTTPEADARVTPVNIPAEVSAANIRDLSKVVGLYDGGENFACKIYHPTGYCRMRTTTDLLKLDSQLWNSLFRLGGIVNFCHVCAYIAVDYVDPTLHATIDARYAKFYVE